MSETSPRRPERVAASETVNDVEVLFRRDWRPGRVLARHRDGWCRVIVETDGKQRELTFSPREMRSPQPTKLAQ